MVWKQSITYNIPECPMDYLLPKSQPEKLCVPCSCTMTLFCSLMIYVLCRQITSDEVISTVRCC